MHALLAPFHEVGRIAALGVEGLRGTTRFRSWWGEYLEQCWFLVSVTALPVFLISIPLGATISLQVGDLARQLGAQSATGSVVVVGIVQQVAPLATAILIAGAGGSAIAADMGARRIRSELDAFEVMGVNAAHRLVAPRLWAGTTVAVMLVSLVVLSGVIGGFVFNVLLQGVSSGAFISGATRLLVPVDLFQSLFKAAIFGFVAALIACSKGMTCEFGPLGVGRAVNRAVVQTFIVVLGANFVISSVFVALFPPRI